MDQKDFILESLARARAEDIAHGFTRFGPHRDDIEFRLSGHDARTSASQGQQRSAILAWKAAEKEFLAREVGEPPVLLLDDILSEFDEGRRSFLLEWASSSSGQTLLTCTDPDLLREDTPAQWYHVNDGKVQQTTSQRHSG